MNYLWHLAVYLSINVIAGSALNLALGCCGLLTLSHGAYFAIGAYTYALVTLSLHGGFLPAIATAVVVGALFSVALSLLASRLTGDRFVIATLAIQALVFSLFLHWFDPNAEPGTWSNLTNGPLGLANIPKPHILGWEIGGARGMAVIAVVTAALCILLSRLLIASPWGRLLKAIRDDELAARALGKRVGIVKSQCLAFSCGMVACAGALAAAYVRYVDPSYASLDQSIFILTIVFVGGAGTIRGPLAGAAALLAISEGLRFTDVPSSIAPDLRMLIYGLLILLMMHLRPQGIAGTYRLE